MDVTNDQATVSGGEGGAHPDEPSPAAAMPQDPGAAEPSAAPGDPVVAAPGPSDIYVSDQPPFEELPEQPPRTARPPAPPPEPEPFLSRQAITRVVFGLVAAAALLLCRRRRRRRARGA